MSCILSLIYATGDGLLIKSYGDKATKELHETGRSKRFPPRIIAKALKRLDQLDAAVSLEDKDR